MTYDVVTEGLQLSSRTCLLPLHTGAELSNKFIIGALLLLFRVEHPPSSRPKGGGSPSTSIPEAMYGVCSVVTVA